MPVVLLLILFTLASQAEDKSYAKQIADFRQEHESSIRSDTGRCCSSAGSNSLREKQSSNCGLVAGSALCGEAGAPRRSYLSRVSQ